jgi:hypothetical protein
VKWPDIRVFQLAYACRIYGQAQYDGTLASLRATTGGKPVDTTNPEHCKATLSWLNTWGCRHIAKSCHDMASQAILEWGGDWVPQLPGDGARLDQLTNDQVTLIGKAYDALARKKAAIRLKMGGASDVRFGPTAAAKIVFVVRPNACLPWDAPIRKELQCETSGQGYVAFLVNTRETLNHILQEAARHGIAAEQLPAVLGRPSSSLPKLIDEYLWITITRKFLPPSREELARWASWL